LQHEITILSKAKYKENKIKRL